MPQVTIIGSAILTYIALCILSWRVTFKMIRDYNRVYYFMVHQVNHVMYYFCLLINKHQSIIPKFDEFVPLVFAQKKKFFFHSKHALKDYTDLYYWLKEDILYTEKYIDKHLHDRDQLIPVEDSLVFLNKIYKSVHFMWRVFAILTVGIWPAVVFKPMK
jgi:hypothetical protein